MSFVSLIGKLYEKAFKRGFNFQELEPKLKVLIDNYESESIYAVVISEGVVYIHTEAGLNKTLN